MKTKNLFYALSIAVAAMTMTACSSENDMTTAPDIESPSENPSEARTWQVSINAGPVATRAISVGGNSGSALFTNWNTGDEVQVVKGGEVVGTLTATASSGNSAYAVLEGTLTGTFAVNDELTLCYHSATFDYTGQVGTLADVSANKSYLMATSTVTAINVAESDINSSESGKLIMSDAAFTAQQAYLDITFTDDCGDPINISSLEITTSGGKLVSSTRIDTDVTNYLSPLTVTPASPTNHFFLALRDEYGSANIIYFKATTSDYGTLTYSRELNLVNGHYYTGKWVFYVEPTISVKTPDINAYHYSPYYCVIGTSESTGHSTNMEFTVSGKSRGCYIDMTNPATVTLNGIDAKLKNHEFISGTMYDYAYVYDIQGTNTIVIGGNKKYALDAGFGNSSGNTIKFQGNGTLTITTTDAQYCGINASNYNTDNNDYDRTDVEVDVTSLLAADGYTVKRSARIDNADGTYTWKYTVKQN